MDDKTAVEVAWNPEEDEEVLLPSNHLSAHQNNTERMLVSTVGASVSLQASWLATGWQPGGVMPGVHHRCR